MIEKTLFLGSMLLFQITLSAPSHTDMPFDPSVAIILFSFLGALVAALFTYRNAIAARASADEKGINVMIALVAGVTCGMAAGFYGHLIIGLDKIPGPISAAMFGVSGTYTMQWLFTGGFLKHLANKIGEKNDK